MSVIPEGFGQVNVQFNGAGLVRDAEVVFGIENVIDATAIQVAERVSAAWIAHLSEVQANTCTLYNVRAKLGPSEDGPSADWGTVQNGTLAQSIESSQVAYLIRKNTNFGGRWNRGRMFMPGCTETNVDDGGVIDTDFLVTMNAQLALFLDGLDDVNVPMVVLHSEFSTLKVDGVTTVVPNPHANDAPVPVVTLTCQSLVATQRRRLRG